MKNKGLIIALIILLTIIVFFLIIFLTAYLNGAINIKRGIFNIGYKNQNVIFDKTFESEEIKNINVKQDAGDIIFKESENEHIRIIVYGANQEEVDVGIDNYNLNIDYKQKRNFVFWNFGTMKSDIIIYLPADYSNDIKINNDYGVCELPDLENASVDIDCDAGDVILGKIKDAKIKCDYGNVQIKEVLNKCDIKANCGNIEIEKIFIQENSTIKADLGNVDINNTNDIYIEADVDLGKTNINKNNRNAAVILKINCDCGNVTINN